MTYASTEISTQDGSPIELYKFTRSSTFWYYTSSAQTIEYLGNMYLPAAIERSGVNQKGDLNQDELSITLPRTNALANTFLENPVKAVTEIELIRGHAFDMDFRIYWKGVVSNIEAGGQSVDINCESIFSSLRRHGVNSRFQRNCRHALYHRGCNAIKESFSSSFVVSSIVGNVVTVNSSTINDYYTIGMLEDPSGSVFYVINQTGKVITLDEQISSSITSVTLYAGCDRARSTCINKFNNLNNFGGFPWIPTRNPFSGGSII